MNRDYSETGFDNLISSTEFKMYVILLKCFMESLNMRHSLYNEQMSSLYANMFIIRSDLLSRHMC